MGAQTHDAESVPKDEALDHAFRVGTAWWDVQVEILAFLKEVSINFTCRGEGESEIHKVALSGEGRDGPLKAMPLLKVMAKCRP